MKIYLVFYNCGDYYCGCPGGSEDQNAGHLLGVTTERGVADLWATTKSDAWVVEWAVSE